MPAVSVIIVSYNSGAERLQQALHSLSAQSFTDFDILIYDNASTDGCTENLPRLDNLTIVKGPENLGFAGGVNKAAAMVQGDWLALLNPDATADSGWLAALMRATRDYPDTKSFGSVQINAEDPDLLDGLGDVYHATGIAWRGGFGQSVALRPDSDREIFAPCAAGCLYERKQFIQLGGLEEDFFCYHEDVDFGFRLRLAGGRSILVHDAVIHHEGSGTTGRYSEFTVYHGTRNRIWTFIRVMPPLLFWPLLPVHLVINFLFVLRNLTTGRAGIYARAMWDGFFKASSAWEARRALQKTRSVSYTVLMEQLSWSPLSLLGRKPVMRKMESSGQ